MVRKALAKFAKQQNMSISALLDAPASSVGAGGDESLASVLLAPTRLYASTMGAVRQVPGLRGAAHITGGGLTENLPRVLPDHLMAKVTPWALPPLFEWLRRACGGLPDDELVRTFNAGIGLVFVVAASDAAAALVGANELCGRPASAGELAAWGAELDGSVAAFLAPTGAAYCTGRGVFVRTEAAAPLLRPLAPPQLA